MVKKYPMTYEEFEKRVIELLLRDLTPEEKKRTLNNLKDLLEEFPDVIKNLYGSTCGYYDRGQMSAFGDGLLKSRAVLTIEMSL